MKDQDSPSKKQKTRDVKEIKEIKDVYAKHPKDVKNGKESKEIKTVIVQHYEKQPVKQVRDFFLSPIVKLKQLNNWAKSKLISTYVRNGDTVLDLAGGKGGDIPKYFNSKLTIHKLYHVDLVPSLLEQARKRSQTRKVHHKMILLQGDMCREDVTSQWESKLQFDVVSCQMALHYSWESESTARMMLYNVSIKLRDRGHFIGTIPDYNRIRKLLEPGLTWSNSISKIRYDCFPVFGARYRFELQDAIQDCPEYLVHFKTLCLLAKEYDLQLVMRQNFADFYQKQHDDIPKDVPQDQWQVFSMYLVFAFQKISKSS
jgi:mRNA (guanine-N7-)-methyltransferase